MGRSKEAGRPVEEFSIEDLKKELKRCRARLGDFGPKSPGGKGLLKRIHEIERRLAREDASE
jgi:hypothetical protein